ncbi:MAG: type II toxin-antitoxin system YafQ family toxin [Epsilonproteobacteria bacterium]|nr:type II toxin-antitoxin system YafQ family toxin [Campylobacterota bacterium]
MRIKRHRKFLKDFRDIKLSDSQFEKFVYYINSLREDKALPPESKDHALSGKYKDCREFHLGGDMLIIYLESGIEEVILMRLGTHSQLF